LKDKGKTGLFKNLVRTVQ